MTLKNNCLNLVGKLNEFGFDSITNEILIAHRSAQKTPSKMTFQERKRKKLLNYDVTVLS